MAFSDTFVVLGMVLAVAAFAVMLTKKVKGASGGSAH
jgi:DHA2 family multidrug resistance protein